MCRLALEQVPLFAYQMQNPCPPGGVVLYHFGDSVTTLITTEQTGHRARIMELDPRYCDLIVKRW